MSEKTEAILQEREKTHGSFRDNSQVSQEIKNIVESRMRNQGNYLPAHMLEALDMIIHKIARISVGNPHEVDHWQDIAGYAELVVREMKRECVEESPITSYQKGDRPINHERN